MTSSPSTMNPENAKPENAKMEQAGGQNGEFNDPQAYYLFRILQLLRQSIRAIDQYSCRLSTRHNVTLPQLICLSAINEHGPMPVTTVAPLPDVHIETIILSPNPDGSHKLVVTLRNRGNTFLKDLALDLDVSGLERRRGGNHTVPAVGLHGDRQNPASRERIVDSTSSRFSEEASASAG